MKAKLYISRKNLKFNVKYIKKRADNRKIIAMIKANAYGTNDIALAKELKDLGIEDFGVASIEEAMNIREKDRTSMILITSPCFDDEIWVAINNNIDISVSDISNLEEINSIGKENNKKCAVHIKVDTGMTRLGFNTKELLKNFDNILKLEYVEVRGIYTHLSCADSDRDYTAGQIEEFEELVKKLSQKINFKYVHILNSDGTVSDIQTTLDTHIRVGMMIYGYADNTKPILKLTSNIIHINNVKKGTRVGYSSTYVAKEDEKIAVVKLGYADGIKRCLSNSCIVKVNGIECNVVGNICMDMFMINISNVKDVNIKDEVVIFDFDNDLKEISKSCNTIPYEIISSIGTRIERVVVDEY